MKIQVLDHGYVEFVEAWGVGKVGFDHEPGHPDNSDYEVGIIEAERQSTQGSFRGWDCGPCTCDFPLKEGSNTHHTHRDNCDSVLRPGDARLLKYLYTHNHSTPFEFAGMVIEVQAPIFVFREWHRHRTQSYNEMSARYAPLPNLNYIPTLERLQATVDTANKQAGTTGNTLTAEYAERFQVVLELQYARAEEEYRVAMSLGVSRELARLVLPVGRYSKMRASANLRNWLRFLTLRCDPATQWETRQYAEAVSEIISHKFPHTDQLWRDQRAGRLS